MDLGSIYKTIKPKSFAILVLFVTSLNSNEKMLFRRTRSYQIISREKPISFQSLKEVQFSADLLLFIVTIKISVANEMILHFYSIHEFEH